MVSARVPNLAGDDVPQFVLVEFHQDDSCEQIPNAKSFGKAVRVDFPESDANTKQALTFQDVHDVIFGMFSQKYRRLLAGDQLVFASDLLTDFGVLGGGKRIFACGARTWQKVIT